MRRIASIILAIIMVAAMLPATALAADSAATAQIWVFGADAHNTTFNGSTVDNTHLIPSSEKVGMSFDSFNPENTLSSSKWGVVDAYNWYSNSVRSAYVYSTVDVKGNNIRYAPGVNATGSEYGAVTFKIQTESGGTFIPSADFYAGADCPKWEVYLTKESEFNALDGSDYKSKIELLPSSDRLFIVDPYSSTAGASNVSANIAKESMTKSGIAVNVDANSVYYLTFISNEGTETREKPVTCIYNDSGVLTREYAYFKLKSFTLSPVTAAAEPQNYSYDISTNVIDESNALYSSMTDGVLPGTAFLTSGSTNYTVFPSGEKTNTASATSSYSISDPYTALNTTLSEVNANGMKIFFHKNYFKAMPSDGKGNHVFVKLRGLKAGTYDVTISNDDCDPTYGTYMKVYFGQTASYVRASAYTLLNACTDYVWHDSRNTNDTTLTVEVPTDGDYCLLFVGDADSIDTTKGGHENYTSNGQIFHISGITLEGHAEEPEESQEQIDYNAAKAVKTAEIAAVSEDAVSETSRINIITASIHADDTEFAPATTNKEVTRGAEVTVIADKIDNYDFLYWRSGLGIDSKVITSSEECTVKAAPGTWLTAVYKRADSTDVSVIFYNADGTVINKYLVAEGEDITIPSLPALAGYPESKGWALNTPENIVTTETVKAEGDAMVFVAQYDDPVSALYTVTVNGEASGGGNYAYGAEVTVTATERENGYGENVFAYWEKDGEVVSFDKSYTFNVAKACALTPVYKKYNPATDILRKIILNDGIAEFIGLDNAVEKGVIFRDADATAVTLGNATHKIAMTTTGNHLSFNNDLTGNGATNFMGYAILTNGNVIYDK